MSDTPEHVKTRKGLTRIQSDVIRLIKETNLTFPSIASELGIQLTYVYRIASRHFTASFLGNRKKRLASLHKNASLSHKKTANQAIPTPAYSDDDPVIVIDCVQCCDGRDTSNPLDTNDFTDANIKDIKAVQNTEAGETQVSCVAFSQNNDLQKGTDAGQNLPSGKDASPIKKEESSGIGKQTISPCDRRQEAAYAVKQSDTMIVNDPLDNHDFMDTDFKYRKRSQSIQEVKPQARCLAFSQNNDLQKGTDAGQNLPSVKDSTPTKKEGFSPAITKQKAASSAMWQEDAYAANRYSGASKNHIIIECNGEKFIWESDQHINPQDISTIIKAFKG